MINTNLAEYPGLVIYSSEKNNPCESNIIGVLNEGDKLLLKKIQNNILELKIVNNIPFSSQVTVATTNDRNGGFKLLFQKHNDTDIPIIIGEEDTRDNKVQNGNGINLLLSDAYVQLVENEFVLFYDGVPVNNCSLTPNSGPFLNLPLCEFCENGITEPACFYDLCN